MYFIKAFTTFNCGPEETTPGCLIDYDLILLVTIRVLLVLVVFKDIMSSKLNKATSTDKHPQNCEDSKPE